MLQSPLISASAKKAVLKKLTFIFLFYIIVFFVVFCYYFVTSNMRYLWVFSVILIVVLILNFIMLIISYFRTPSLILKVDDEGFEYISVSKIKYKIKWGDIVSFKVNKDLNEIVISYNGKLGVESIEVIYGEGIKIKEAWEQWKKGKDNQEKIAIVESDIETVSLGRYPLR